MTLLCRLTNPFFRLLTVFFDAMPVAKNYAYFKLRFFVALLRLLNEFFDVHNILPRFQRNAPNAYKPSFCKWRSAP